MASDDIDIRQRVAVLECRLSHAESGDLGLEDSVNKLVTRLERIENRMYMMVGSLAVVMPIITAAMEHLLKLQR